MRLSQDPDRRRTGNPRACREDAQAGGRKGLSSRPAVDPAASTVVAVVAVDDWKRSSLMDSVVSCMQEQWQLVVAPMRHCPGEHMPSGQLSAVQVASCRAGALPAACAGWAGMATLTAPSCSKTATTVKATTRRQEDDEYRTRPPCMTGLQSNPGARPSQSGYIPMVPGVRTSADRATRRRPRSARMPGSSRPRRRRRCRPRPSAPRVRGAWSRRR